MRITNIAYEQLYPTGVYANQRYRAEATLDDGDDIEWCYKQLKEQVEKTFVALNPQINWSDNPYGSINVYAPSEETKPKDTVDNIIESIKSCKEVKVLESYKLIAKSNPAIQSAYDETMVVLIKKFEEQ